MEFLDHDALEEIALGATVLWSLGSVAGLEIAGAPFFLGEPANNGWAHPVPDPMSATTRPARLGHSLCRMVAALDAELSRPHSSGRPSAGA